MFQMILDKYKQSGNTKAALRLELKLAKVLWSQKKWDKLGPILEGLHASCRTPTGSDDLTKGNQLLEIYALRVSCATESSNYDIKLQKQLYQAALPIVQKAIGNPRMQGIIYECGGKMELRDGHFENARSAFFEAFKCFDDSHANPECLKCLMYLVMANMLAGSRVDPFQDHRAKAHENNAQIILMKEALKHFQNLDLKAFFEAEKTLRSKIDDRWVVDYLSAARRKLQKLAFLQFVKPYTSLSLSSVEKRLGLEPDICEGLVVELVLDGEVDVSIAQVGRMLSVNRAPGTATNRKYHACQQWVTQLSSLTRNILCKVN